jgi:hypothetical protein
MILFSPLSLCSHRLILLVTYVLSKLIPYSFRKNDDATWRRRKFHEFINDPTMTCDAWKSQHKDVVHVEQFWVNARGMSLLTYTMVPKSGKVDAVVCFFYCLTANS